MAFDTVCVVGLGYIGLPTAAILASKQKKVFGVDIDQEIVDTINSGEIHIIEPGLDELVKSAVESKFLQASKNPKSSDVYIIAVPTPFIEDESKDNIPKPDLKFIKSASKSVASVLKKGDLIILESTSPIGTTHLLSSWLAEHRQDLSFPHLVGENSDVRIAFCPERVLPGQAVRELVENDRIVGGITNKCSKKAVDFYKSFVNGDCLETNAKTAEMAKLTENASRDVGIAFANELSMICDSLNIDVWELIDLANKHPRVNILQPGPGVGGHCIAVDPWFIVDSVFPEAKLIRAAREVNDFKPEWVTKKINNAIDDFLSLHPKKTRENLIIACFGLSYKPNIDDLRESPSMMIAQNIANSHVGKVLCVEPNIDFLKNSTNLKLVSFQEAENKADIAVLLVDHDEFKKNGAPKIEKIIDTKGIW